MKKIILLLVVVILGIIYPSCDLSKMYDTNTDPEVSSFTASHTAGSPGTQVAFRVEGYDHESTTLTYMLDCDGGGFEATQTNTTGVFTFSYTYNTPGYYTAVALVRDEGGKTSEAYRHISITDTTDPTNHRPDCWNLFPVNDEDSVSLNVTLVWNGSDYDGDDIKYNVYYGLENPPALMLAGTTNTSCGTSLRAYWEYYWYVVAYDPKGAYKKSPTWKFKTGRE